MASVRSLAATCAIALSALLPAASADATFLQPIGKFAQPTYVTSDPGNPSRLFVVERKGKIELVANGAVSTFADLSPIVECGAACVGERGLLSIALAPDFDSSGRLYVDYANGADGTIHVDELVASSPSGPVGIPREVLAIPHSEEINHNGGQLQLGPEGDLYVSTGDGGGPNDKHHNSQDLTSALGKILRIDPDPAGPTPYTVPPGNPFAADGYPAETIWSYGLRNPYRFSFDRLSGDMVVADVGQSAREEVDFAPASLGAGAGANYGWNCREGLLAGPGDDPGCATFPPRDFSDPVFDYPHTPDPDLGGERCSIIGGYVARDPGLGALYGHYVYADYCSGAIRALQLPATASGQASGDCSLGLETNSPVSFGEDSAGRLYVVEEGGLVSRIGGPPPADCPAQPSPPAQPGKEARAPGPTFVGIEAQRRRVERGKTALLTVWVSPCSGRKGEMVKLLRNGHPNGTRFLSRACTARFLPRVHRGTTFAAATTAERGYEPGRSRQLKIRLAHHRPR
jgi:hypothetical protein